MAATYTYDQVGNRVKMVQGSTTTYAYGSFNRLSSAGSTTYTYDPYTFRLSRLLTTRGLGFPMDWRNPPTPPGG